MTDKKQLLDITVQDFEKMIREAFANVPSLRLSDEQIKEIKSKQESAQWRTDPLGLMPYFNAFTDIPLILFGVADFLRGISMMIDSVAEWIEMIASSDD